jgi:hypothetical protein
MWNSVRLEDAMAFHSATTGLGRAVLNALDDHDDARVPADQVKADLTAVFLFIVIGLSLTAAFFMLGFGAEIGEILAAFGR